MGFCSQLGNYCLVFIFFRMYLSVGLLSENLDLSKYASFHFSRILLEQFCMIILRRLVQCTFLLGMPYSRILCFCSCTFLVPNCLISCTQSFCLLAPSLSNDFGCSSIFLSPHWPNLQMLQKDVHGT